MKKIINKKAVFGTIKGTASVCLNKVQNTANEHNEDAVETNDIEDNEETDVVEEVE